MTRYKRWLIAWMGYHGRRHQASRHVSVARMLAMGGGY